LSTIVVTVLLSIVPTIRADEKPRTLPGTQLLDWTDDLSVRIIDDAHHFLDRKLAESIVSREKLWSRDFSSNDAYEKSIEQMYWCGGTTVTCRDGTLR